MAQEQGSDAIFSPPKRRGWTTYATRLTATFASVAAVTVIISLALLAVAWGQRFETYSNERVQNLSEIVADSLAQHYAIADGWTAASLETVPSMIALSGGLGIRVVDNYGAILFDGLSIEEDGDPQAIADHQQAYHLPIIVDSETVGSVYVVSPSPFLSESDFRFRLETLQSIAIAGVIAVILALIFGMFFSRGLISPLLYITSVANEIRRGNLAVRTGMEGRDEFSQLGRTMDDMVDAIERNVVMERQLTTDLAHELRTPLMAIQATIEAMVDGVLPVDSVRLQTLDSEVIRLGRLVEAQLKLARLERGRDAMNLEEINLTERVSEIVASHEALAASAEMTMSFTSHSDVVVRGDADLLRQAMINLISNAGRYTPAGGSIDVEVREYQNMAQIVVADTGVGISKDDIDHIFTRFWRADSGRSSKGGGLGIGLAMVKEIATRHHGWVDVQSVLGQGTTFTLNIPLLVQEKSRKQKH
jgi:signal transduction histidine kinase